MFLFPSKKLLHMVADLGEDSPKRKEDQISVGETGRVGMSNAELERISCADHGAH